MSTSSRSEALADLRFLSKKLDSQFRLALGLKIGWDGLLGLIPGVGDLVTSSVSFCIVVRAALLGCPFSVIARMGLNILVENLVDIVPFAGNLFDFFWKSNLKNLALLEQFLDQPRKTTWISRILILVFLIGLIVLMFSLIALGVKLATELWDHFAISLS